MKRIIAFALTILTALTALCLASCSMPLKSSVSRKNGLDCAFQSEVSISLDRLQAEGVLKRFGSGAWEIEFSSPNTLSGVKLEFSEGNTSASYKGLSFSVPQSAVPVRAMMLNLIKAVDENAKLDELKGEEKDGSLEISGELEGGKYLLIVDKDGRLSGFEMDNNKLKITFSELTLIDEKAPSSSETTASSSEETTTASTSETSTETTAASE